MATATSWLIVGYISRVDNIPLYESDDNFCDVDKCYNGEIVSVVGIPSSRHRLASGDYLENPGIRPGGRHWVRFAKKFKPRDIRLLFMCRLNYLFYGEPIAESEEDEPDFLVQDVVPLGSRDN